MESKLLGYTKNRLKGSSFVHEAKKLKKQQQHALVLDMPVTPLGFADITDTVKIDISAVTTCMYVLHLEQGTDDDNTKQTKTLAKICEQNLPEVWTHVYTDGSATSVFQNCGAGIVTYFPNSSTETASAATRIHYINYKAESEGLMKAISLAVDSKPEEHHDCISHRSSTSPVQQQLVTSSKSSATIQQQLQMDPPLDTRPFWSSGKSTSRQARKERCTNRTTRC